MLGQFGGDAKSYTYFFCGALVALAVAYFGMARPMTLQFAELQGHLDRLDAGVRKVAGEADAARDANELLGLLAEQGRRTESAAESLDQMRRLHQRLEDESAEARLALESFAALKAEADRAALQAREAQARQQQMLAAHQQSLEALGQVVADWEALQQRLAESAPIGKYAQQVSDDLLAMQADLLCRGGDTAAAKAALDELLAIHDELDSQGGLDRSQQRMQQLVALRRQIDGEEGLAQAQRRLGDLIHLKDEVLSQTGDLATAIETIELAGDLHEQLGEVIPTLQQFRTWMTEILVMQPTLERAMTALRPLTELGNLRRLSVEQLRQVAENMRRPSLPSGEAALATSQPQPDASSTDIRAADNLRD